MDLQLLVCLLASALLEVLSEILFVDVELMLERWILLGPIPKDEVLPMTLGFQTKLAYQIHEQWLAWLAVGELLMS